MGKKEHAQNNLATPFSEEGLGLTLGSHASCGQDLEFPCPHRLVQKLAESLADELTSGVTTVR